MKQPWHGSLRGTLPTLVLLLAAMLLAPAAHATTGSLTDSTVADFNSGGPSTDAYVAETDDGEVMLAPTAGVEFYGTAVPAGWSSTPMESGGAAIVQDGALQADGARVSADLAHGPGRSLEFVATFGAAPSQSAGLGDFSAPEGARWTMFSTQNTSTDLYARTNDGTGGSVDTLIPGSFLGAPHRYAIDWNLASVGFFIDGALVATHPVSPASSMPPFAADEQLGGQSIALDWLRISPYPATGIFQSRVLDAGRRVDWEALSWTNGGPGGTAVFLSARTGDTPTPDGTWTSFAPIALSGDPVGGSSRYVQYRVDLMSGDPTRTPTLDSVSISYTDTTVPAVVVDSVSDPLIGPADTSTDVTWHAGEDGAYSVRVGGADCTSGDDVGSGSYANAPAQVTTTVSAGQLAEGPNTVRVCVADTAGNQGSQTTSVVKDTTAPGVVVDSVSDTLIGSPDTGTDVTWHADEDGAFSVRVGVAGWSVSAGMGCTTETTVASGSYTGAPGPTATTVSASDLRETLNPIRVCVIDAAGNLGSHTVYVVKDLTAPTVAVDSVSDTLIGSSDTGTDVTWHANDVGPYSIRVGGTSCTTGTEVASGIYPTARAQHTTTVSAGDLSEGANTIRVCVADLWGNDGAATAGVVKDATGPAVAIDTVSDTLIGPSDTDTDVTWHSDEDGSYSVRVGGDGCTSGTEVENGNYTGAPAQHVTTVSAGDLSEGANAIRVCVTDAAGNQGSETTSVAKDTTAPTVAVDLVSDNLLGPSDTGTDVTWHANEDGAYSVRVGGADCTTGDVAETGSYATAPTQRTTTLSAGQLAEGPNAIRVCVADAAGNSGSETTSVVKDTTAPHIAIDTVSNALLGSSDTGTDVTWHANEDGPYSVRVGGEQCTSGAEVASGGYTGAPAQHVTTVSAGQLAEGANTIRVCVADGAGNSGSETTSVVKDTTAPAVAVDSVSDNLIGPSDTDTDVTWHADDDGTYSVRVGGGNCTSGDEVESGGYTGAPAQHVTTVSAGDLSEGANTIRVCVTDAVGNQGSETTSVLKDLNPPIVAIDAVSDSLVGPAAPASDITWQASEGGTYSVRVGGGGCTTGNVIAGGSYGGPPEQITTTVTVADLSEGANTIRVCVTDAAGSHGSQATSLVKDTTAPTVAIDSVSDTLIGPNDASTDVTWHAGENGIYGVRVSGASCTAGTEVETATYTGAPAQHITTVSSGDLSEGANTIRVCVTDAAGNQDSQTTSVTKDTAERVTLTFGPQADARVEEANPSSNFGTSSSLRVEGGSAPDIESYLRFQVMGVLGTVEQAKLRLWVSNGTPDGPAAYKTDWAGAETAITWNNRAPRTSGPTDDKGNIPVNAFVEYDVTPLVVGNGAHGFVLAGTSSDALTVSSREASNVSQRPQLIVTAVVEGVDTEPPTAPTGLTASAAWPTEVDLNWTESIDNVGVTAYEIYRDGALLTTVGDVTNYTDMTALASTSYEYTVRALDAVSNQSDPSNEAEVTTPAPTADPVVMAAGDQACDPTASAFNGGLGTSTACRQKYTSDLLVNRDLAAVLALGDIQYECGGYNAFLQSYDPTWGRVKSITYPVPGNHEYHSEGGMDCDPTGNALGYFNYFGAAAGDPAKGYYSFDVGAWHMIALNSNCAKVSCATSSAQVSWLRQDLAANPDTCTLAFWHHPRFTSGTNAPGSTLVKPLYQALYDYNADVLLVGHDHDYERFALQDPEGALDPVRGIREFVVGTGGKSFHNWGAIQPGSEARNNDTFGVLKLVLSPTSYEWRFIPEAGKTYTDTGSTPCAV